MICCLPVSPPPPPPLSLPLWVRLSGKWIKHMICTSLPFSFRPINPGPSLCYCLVVFTRRKGKELHSASFWSAFARCLPNTAPPQPIVYLIWQLTRLGSVHCLRSGTRKYLVLDSLQTFESDIHIIPANELWCDTGSAPSEACTRMPGLL